VLEIERPNMNEWIERLAQALGEDPATRQEIAAVLGLARDVAHGVERRLAPVSTYLVGVYVGRSAAAGAPRQEALGRAMEAAASLLPDTSSGGS